MSKKKKSGQEMVQCNCKVDRSVHQTEKQTSQATYLCKHNGVNRFIELYSYLEFSTHVSFMQENMNFRFSVQGD